MSKKQEPRGFATLCRRSDARGNEVRERTNVSVDTGAVERGEVRRAIFNPDDCPGIASRRKHGVHQETGHPSVSIWIRMDVAEHPMAQYGAYASIRFILQEIE